MNAQRPRVAMLISSGYAPDVRLQKQAHTLATAGYRVTIIAWDRLRAHPPTARESATPLLAASLAGWPGRCDEPPGPVTIVRLQIAAGYRTGRPLLAKMPRFWARALHELRRFRPDIVHACDLDTLPAAYCYRCLTGTPVIYDAREFYAGMVQANVGPALSRALDALDGWLTPRVDAVLAVGERLAARHRALGGRVWIVPNAHPLPPPDLAATSGAQLRQRLALPDGALLVVYVGYLTPDRLLAPLLDAVSVLPDVWLLVGGTGPQAERVAAYAARCSRIRPLGWVPLEQVAAVVSSADVVYYGLDAQHPNSAYFMPNLALTALAVGRPLLTTPVGEIAEVVRVEACGVVMEDATASAAIAALGRLQDPALRAALAGRALALGQSRYDWRCAASQLLDAYICTDIVKNCR